MHVDAIVNPTNEEKVGYSGIDLAIHTLAGKDLDKECAALPPLSLGKAQITRGYALPAKYVIHTAGPVWYGGSHGEGDALYSCYRESLKLAVDVGCESVAFPLISSGVYCYPKDQVLKLAVKAIADFLFENEITVYLCVFDRDSYTFSQKLFADIKAFIDDAYVSEQADMQYDADFSLAPKSEAPCRQTRANFPIMASQCSPPPRRQNADEALAEYLKKMDRSFQKMLFDLIDESGMSDVECYKRANVDKRIFSKIKSNGEYRPSKPTAIAFAIALRLDLEKTQKLLATAGFALSESRIFDKIIRYFLHKGNYDIFEINEALFEFDQPLLGSGS